MNFKFTILTYPNINPVFVQLKTKYHVKFNKNINKDTQKMPQSRSTAFLRSQKETRWGTKYEKTNGILAITDIQPRKCKRRTELERSAEATTGGIY